MAIIKLVRVALDRAVYKLSFDEITEKVRFLLLS